MYLFRLWFASLEKLLCAAMHSWIGSSYVMTFKYISTSMYSMYTIGIVLRIMLIRSWTCRFNNSANDGMFLGFCFSRLPQLTQMTVLKQYDQVSPGPSVAVVFSLRFASDQVIQVIPDSSPPGHPPFPCPSFDIFYVFPCQAAALTVPNVHRVMQSVERGMALSWSKSSDVFWLGSVLVRCGREDHEGREGHEGHEGHEGENTWNYVKISGLVWFYVTENHHALTFTRNGFPSSKGALPFAVEYVEWNSCFVAVYTNRFRPKHPNSMLLSVASFSIFQPNISFQPPSTSTSSFNNHH